MPSDYKYQDTSSSDPRDKYDPTNPLQAAEVNMMPYVNNNLYKDFQTRMENFVRMVNSKNLKDQGLTEGDV